MSSATFAWAWDQEIPAEPKLLLIVLVESCGMAREYDVDPVHISKKAGIPMDDLPLVLQHLAARDLIDILDQADTVDGITTVYVRYPLQDWDLPFGGKKLEPGVNNLPGWLYVIAAGDGVTKIGITNNREVRIRALEKASGRELKLAWSLRMTMSEVRSFEQKLHRMFAASRLKGEWFNASTEDVIVAAIEVCGSEGERT